MRLIKASDERVEDIRTDVCVVVPAVPGGDGENNLTTKNIDNPLSSLSATAIANRILIDQ